MRIPVSISWVLVVTACAGAPAAPEQKAAAERQLLQPFLQDAVVDCDSLQIELTANFHANVSELAAGAGRTMRREPGDGYVDLIWTNAPGSPPMQFTIGEPMEFTEQGVVRGHATRFVVTQQVVRRVFAGTHALALSAHTGPAMVRRAGSKQADRVGEFRIANGAASSR